jgi:hypothetical protein
MTSRSGIIDPSKRPLLPLFEGHLIRCPKCLKLRHPESDLRRLHRNEDYAMDLAVVYQCRREKNGGCNHVFALADQRILLAFLNGDLVPQQRLIEANARISELEAQIDAISGDTINEHEKVVNQ